MAEAEWSMEGFGGARLGGQGRTKRLVALGGQVAANPAGNITAVFTGSAEREAGDQVESAGAGVFVLDVDRNAAG